MIYKHRYKIILAVCFNASVSGFQLARHARTNRVLPAPLSRNVAARFGKDERLHFDTWNTQANPPSTLFSSATPESSWTRHRSAVRNATTKFASFFRRRVAAVCFAALLWLSVSSAAFAVTGGRVGGSFGK